MKYSELRFWIKSLHNFQNYVIRKNVHRMTFNLGTSVGFWLFFAHDISVVNFGQNLDCICFIICWRAHFFTSKVIYYISKAPVRTDSFIKMFIPTGPMKYSFWKFAQAGTYFALSKKSDRLPIHRRLMWLPQGSTDFTWQPTSLAPFVKLTTFFIVCHRGSFAGFYRLEASFSFVTPPLLHFSLKICVFLLLPKMKS